MSSLTEIDEIEMNTPNFLSESFVIHFSDKFDGLMSAFREACDRIPAQGTCILYPDIINCKQRLRDLVACFSGEGEGKQPGVWRERRDGAGRGKEGRPALFPPGLGESLEGSGVCEGSETPEFAFWEATRR